MAFTCIQGHALACTGMHEHALTLAGRHRHALACIGIHWHALACTDMHWQALATTCMQWHALACGGTHWHALACMPWYVSRCARRILLCIHAGNYIACCVFQVALEAFGFLFMLIITLHVVCFKMRSTHLAIYVC